MDGYYAEPNFHDPDSSPDTSDNQSIIARGWDVADWNDFGYSTHDSDDETEHEWLEINKSQREIKIIVRLYKCTPMRPSDFIKDIAVSIQPRATFLDLREKICRILKISKFANNSVKLMWRGMIYGLHNTLWESKIREDGEMIEALLYLKYANHIAKGSAWTSLIKPGLVFKGTCDNPKCCSYNQDVICPVGNIFIATRIPTFKCPHQRLKTKLTACDHLIAAKSFGIYDGESLDTTTKSYMRFSKIPEEFKRTIFRADKEEKTAQYVDVDDNCSICLDGMNNCALKALNCGHVFHNDCAEKALKLNSRCPLCVCYVD